MQPVLLDSRFDPYILNKASDPNLKELCSKLDNIFQAQADPENLKGFKPISSFKQHILTHDRLPGWIVKRQRTDQYSAGEEQNIYRVLIMGGIRKVIEEHQFSSVVVPQKYLYEFKGKWFVIAEKMNLVSHLKIDSVPWESEVPQDCLRDLSPQQAKELAVICYEGELPDVGAHNLMYVQTGEVCPFDSEPLTFSVQKKWSRFPIPGIERAVKFFLANGNVDRLSKICKVQKARQEVEKVRKRTLVKHIAKFTAQAALPLIAAAGLCYAAMTNPTGTLVKFATGSAFVLTAINGVTSLGLLGLSIFGEKITGSFEYEGDLMDKYAIRH